MILISKEVKFIYLTSFLFLKIYDIIILVIIMTYLDYSATTPVSEEVLQSFVEASRRYPGNPNSLHKLGVEANKMIDKATEQVANLLKVKPQEIIYTSGSSESNNLALKGIAFKYQNRGKHIITTPLEHSSIYEPLNYLKTQGFEISYVELNEDGTINLEHLKKIIRDDTILVSVCAVNSELGIIQPLEAIASIIKEYPKCYFHVDMTQAVGKIPVNCDNIDLISFSAHKFYGLKGIGVLIKKEKIELEPLIHGGKSTTKYRSGTPCLPLIVSLAKALRLALINLDGKYEQVKQSNNKIRKILNNYELIKINSPINAIPHILNISILGVKPETMLHALEKEDIYVSTQSACSSNNAKSAAVYAVTHDTLAAKSSLRISLSSMTTEEDIEKLENALDKCYKELTCLR